MSQVPAISLSPTHSEGSSAQARKHDSKRADNCCFHQGLARRPVAAAVSTTSISTEEVAELNRRLVSNNLYYAAQDKEQGYVTVSTYTQEAVQEAEDDEKAEKATLELVRSLQKEGKLQGFGNGNQASTPSASSHQIKPSRQRQRFSTDAQAVVYSGGAAAE